MPLPEWQDRRGMFQKGREVHEPSLPAARRTSEASITEKLARSVSNTSSNAASAVQQPESPNAAKNPALPAFGTVQQRRRSSAASGSGMFGNLTSLKRGGDDYQQRRSSIDEMSSGRSGFLGGFWNTTVRGGQKNKPESAMGAGPGVGASAGGGAAAKEVKRGVME